MPSQAKSGPAPDRSFRIDGALPGTPATLRRLNQMQVFSAVRRNGPLSRPKIASMTGLSKVTVNEVVSDLLESELVTEELESPHSRPSRPGPLARLISFHNVSRTVVGIDVGAAKALVFVADLSGTRLAERRMITEGAKTRAELLGQLRTAINETIAEAGVDIEDVVAMGVGTPGVVDPSTKTIKLAPQLPDWEGFSLADELRLTEHCPVIVANEVHLAVLGEQWQGVAQGVNHVAYLHIGVGVGLGIIMDGSLRQGASGAGGEIGYLPIQAQDDSNRPEETGRFEWLVGGPAYARRAEELMAAGEAEMLVKQTASESLDAATIYRLASEGVAEAQVIVDELTDITARGVAAFLAVLDPELVIIGGGVSKAGEALRRPLVEKVAKLVPHTPRFAISSLGDEAVAVGALRVAIERWESDIFTLTDSKRPAISQ